MGTGFSNMNIEEVGKLLRKKRRESELSIKTLSEISGVGVSSICRLEKGTGKSYKLGTIEKAFEALGINLNIKFETEPESLAA